MLINDESLGCDSGLRKDRSTTGEGDVDRGLDTPPTYAGSIEYVYYGKCTGHVYLQDDSLRPEAARTEVCIRMQSGLVTASQVSRRWDSGYKVYSWTT